MERIIELIRERENFILAGHIGPDGDAIGSCFALALALDKIGKNVQVLLEAYAPRYYIIPGREFLLSGETADIQPDIFIALDCADLDRLGSARPLFERAKTTVCIDHHDTNKGFADYNFIEPTASSTSEMTFRVIEQLTSPTQEIATAVYAGIVNDTGGFRFSATAKSTMEIAARLMGMGINFTEIYSQLMHQHRFVAAKAMGLALENSTRTDDKRIVYTYMTREMLKSVEADTSDLDGVVEYLMGTRNAYVAALMYEKRHGQVKVSLRSKGANVGNAARLLGGGGHILAAGATVQGTISEVIERTLALVAKEVALFDPPKEEQKKIIHKSGIINIRKEKDYTSHDVVAIIRKITGEKAGHTGTLDPNATGVLPVCIGRATKLADYIVATDKTYAAEIVFGITTDTGDITGNVLTQKDASVDFEDFRKVAESFIGDYLQTPPMYSAIKIGGKKLYELAREGKTVERKPREVKIYDLQVFERNGKFFLDVTCSKGTYIRTLCMDIGEILGCGAVMGDLTRTKNGIFDIENSVSLDEVRAAAEEDKLHEIIIPADKVLPYPVVYIKPKGIIRASCGNPVLLELIENSDNIKKDDKVWVKTRDNRIIGLYRYTSVKKGILRAEVLF
ncbi:MAG: tRNA pseudouridine(55) synthase TruB [Clostridiales bacterium]|jgi:tRNA pseudouridine55 synthase|nr:tRNA pseudouridine(55) synthase TruB [Clostridiales bacterium]